MAFCKHCGAPQIRVNIEPGPSPESDLEATPAGLTVQTLRTRGEAPKALSVALLAGLLEAFFTLFGLGILVGGFLAVVLYRRRTLLPNLSAGMGARLGLISGAIGFGIFAVFRAIGLMVLHNGPELRAEVMKALEQSASQYPAAQIQPTLQYLQSSQGWALIVAMSTLFTLTAFLLISTLGGVIAAAVLGKNKVY